MRDIWSKSDTVDKRSFFFEGWHSQVYWHLRARGWRRNDDGWKDEWAGGEGAPSLSVHKMPRPSYEVDSVSLSTDPKVTESFWDYLNGRIDRLILWPSRKGYCSALYPFFSYLHSAPRPFPAFRSWESWLSATRMPLPSYLYTHLVHTLRNVDGEYWYTQSNLI